MLRRCTGTARSVVRGVFIRGHCSLLAGKTAVVTGSTSGIGLGVAKVLASHGASVVLNGFGDSAPAIKAVTASAASAGAGGKVAFVDADLLSESGVQHLAKASVDALGHIDIIVNNAGMQHVASVEKFDLAAWNRVLSLNLTAGFLLSKALLPAMLTKGFGRIVNIASVHGLVGSTHKSAYVASKHGVVGFSKVLALETAGTGVTSNCICPGWVLTPLVQAQIDAKAKELGLSNDAASAELLASKQPSKTFATPEDIGELAAFLCSKAADQITGASIPIDGGWTAQ